VVCACTGREASVYAHLLSATVRVDRSQLNEAAEVGARARFYAVHERSDQVVLHGGWLNGDSGTVVAQLGLALPKPLFVGPGESTESDLVNRSVTNGSLVGLCDLQLDLGLTVSGARDPDRSLSLGFPVKIECR
jgi:hypothetical protein